VNGPKNLNISKQSKGNLNLIIQAEIKKLQQNGMEDSVAGLLEVHLDRSDKEGTIKLTKLGLTKRILDIIQIDHILPKKPPAAPAALPIDKEGEIADYIQV